MQLVCADLSVLTSPLHIEIKGESVEPSLTSCHSLTIFPLVVVPDCAKDADHQAIATEYGSRANLDREAHQADFGRCLWPSDADGDASSRVGSRDAAAGAITQLNALAIAARLKPVDAGPAAAAAAAPATSTPAASTAASTTPAASTSLHLLIRWTAAVVATMLPIKERSYRALFCVFDSFSDPPVSNNGGSPMEESLNANRLNAGGPLGHNVNEYNAGGSLDAGDSLDTGVLLATCSALEHPATLLHRPHQAAALSPLNPTASAPVLSPYPALALAAGCEALFLTYGDSQYARQRHRITDQAARSGFFTLVRSPCERSDAQRLVASSIGAQQTLTLERGGGYWIWKALVVQEGLRLLRDGDVLVYADAGCTLHPEYQQAYWSKVCQLSEVQPIEAYRLSDAVCWNGCAANRCWMRGDVAHRVLGDQVQVDAFYSVAQIEANRLLILNCASSRSLVDEWARLAREESELFTDDVSSLPNHSSFVEHRHDQALFSALMFARGWHGSVDGWEFLEATRLRPQAEEFWGRDVWSPQMTGV